MTAFKNILYFIIIITLLIVNTDAFTQSKSNRDIEKNDIKKSLNFDDWPGKYEDIRNGINLSNSKIFALSDATEIKPKNTFFISRQKNGVYFVKYRSQWHLNKKDFVEITLSFLNSAIEAHEYLIDWYMMTPLPLEIRKKSRDIPPIVGDVSFYKGCLFVRNNIIVGIHAEGKMVSRVKAIAEEIDGLLLMQEIFQINDFVKPKIIRDSTNIIKIVEP